MRKHRDKSSFRPHARPSSSKPAFEIPKSWRLVGGSHALRELFEVRGRDIQKLLLREGFEASEELRELEAKARALKVEIEKKPITVLDRIFSGHQGALAYVSTRPTLNFEGLKNFNHSILIAADGLEDPHNLGALIRTAWLVGAHGLIISADRSVGLTPTVHKVACGGVEHVPVEEVVQFTSTFERLKEQGYWIFGLSHKSKKDLFSCRLPEKVVWVVGAEDRGLRGGTERICDELVRLPQSNAAASYNASVAGAMAMMETFRQHHHRT